jgi:predicted porin
MTSTLNSRAGTCAVLAVLGLFASGMASANAADLGGNCCADLEERIAELEATTARKGNRKVSLTVTGWVNHAVFFWDDGVEQNAYVGTNSLEQSRFKFLGEAKFADGWTAGYTLEIGVSSAPSNRFSQANNGDTGAAGTSSALTVRRSNWFIKSRDFGKVTVGLDGEATYHLLDDADGTNTRNYSDAEAAGVAFGAFQVRVGGALNALRWTDIVRGGNNATVGQGGRRNVVRYDSPELAGFVATASWGEDDIGSVALTYKNTLGDFKLVGKAGYASNTDENTQTCHASLKNEDCQWWGVAGTVMHVPTGLYAYAAYGQQNDHSRATDFTFAGIDTTDTMWFVQGGIEKKFMPLGITTLFGEYRNDEGGSNPGRSLAGAARATNFVKSSDVNSWAAGIVQNVDAAAMDLYVIYRHSDGEVTNGSNVTTTLDDLDMVLTGARIQF